MKTQFDPHRLPYRRQQNPNKTPMQILSVENRGRTPNPIGRNDNAEVSWKRRKKVGDYSRQSFA